MRSDDEYHKITTKGGHGPDHLEIEFRDHTEADKAGNWIGWVTIIVLVVWIGSYLAVTSYLAN